MNTMTVQPFAAFVGIDWADTKHDVCIQSANSLRREFAVIPHKVEAIDEWAQSLHRRFSGPIAIAVELSKGRSSMYCKSTVTLSTFQSIHQPWQNIVKRFSQAVPEMILLMLSSSRK